MIKVGDYVKVPPLQGNISALQDHGHVTAISEPYCRVKIRYGRKLKGTWEGKIQDLYIIADSPKEGPQ